MMTKEEICRDYRLAANKREQIKVLADLNACSKQEIADILIEDGQEVPKWYQKKEEPQEPEKVTVEEAMRLTAKITEQTLTIEALKEQNNALGKSNAALSEKLDAAREAAGKAIEDRKILKEKTDAQEKRIEDLRNLINDRLETKEQNRRYREQNRRYRKIILALAMDLRDAN